MSDDTNDGSFGPDPRGHDFKVPPSEPAPPDREPASKRHYGAKRNASKAADLLVADREAMVAKRAAQIAQQVREEATQKKLDQVVDPLVSSERPETFGTSGALDVLWAGIKISALRGQGAAVIQGARVIAELEGTLIQRAVTVSASVDKTIMLEGLTDPQKLLRSVEERYGPRHRAAYEKVFSLADQREIPINSDTEADLVVRAALLAEGIPADRIHKREDGDDDADDVQSPHRTSRNDKDE
jgi:hypothetical protein